MSKLKYMSCIFWVFILLIRLYPQIVITEVMFDPDGSEQTDEFVEILNVSESVSVDLTGWQIGDGTGNDFLIDAGYGTGLMPGQYGIILDADYFEESTTYDFLIPGEALILTVDGTTIGSGGLSNSSSETVTLCDSNGVCVAQYTYSIGNQPGHSDEKIDPYGSDESGNWADSFLLQGTPGFENSVMRKPVSEQAVITVFPNPFSPDGDGFEDETEIVFEIPFETANVNLRVYDVRGRLIRTLLGGAETVSRGNTVWDGTNDSREMMRMGIYIVHLEALHSNSGSVVETKTTVVLGGSL